MKSNIDNLIIMPFNDTTIPTILLQSPTLSQCDLLKEDPPSNIPQHHLQNGLTCFYLDGFSETEASQLGSIIKTSSSTGDHQRPSPSKIIEECHKMDKIYKYMCTIRDRYRSASLGVYNSKNHYFTVNKDNFRISIMRFASPFPPDAASSLAKVGETFDDITNRITRNTSYSRNTLAELIKRAIVDELPFIYFTLFCSEIESMEISSDYSSWVYETVLDDCQTKVILIVEGIRKNTLFLIRGKDNDKPAWHYVLVDAFKIKELKDKEKGTNMDVTDYGTIVKSGWGTDPPAAIKEEIESKYE